MSSDSNISVDRFLLKLVYIELVHRITQPFFICHHVVVVCGHFLVNTITRVNLISDLDEASQDCSLVDKESPYEFCDVDVISDVISRKITPLLVNMITRVNLIRF